MARIELSLDASYQAAEWGAWEAFREICANAKDGEVRNGQPSSVKWNARSETLRVRNEMTRVPAEALLMGQSGSRGRSDCIGTFGEGLPMALLTLCRIEGLGVDIINDDESWAPTIERSINFAADVLVVRTHKIKPRGYFEVSVSGVTKELWESIQTRMLWIDPKFDPAQAIRTNSGPERILMQPAYTGCVYNKGVFVKKHPELRYGFDLAQQLNRDRSMMDEWDLKWKLSNLLADGVAKHPEIFGNVVLDLLEEGEALEVGSTYAFKHSEAVRNAVLARFDEQNGEGAVPVANISESRELDFLGKKGIVVSSQIKEIIEQARGSFEDVKAKAGGEVKARYGWHDISAAEQEVLTTCCEAVARSSTCVSRNYDILSHVKVVDFNDPRQLGRFATATQEICLAKSRLSNLLDTLETLIHEVAHIAGDDGSRSHTDAQISIAAEVIVSLLQERT